MKKDNYVKKYLRNFISNEFFRKIIRFLHLSILGRKIAFKLLYPGDGNIEHTIGNINARFCAQNYSELAYLTRTVVGAGDERPAVAELLKNIKPGDVVYDVGAFIGFHSVFFAKAVGSGGKVIAFEPAVSGQKAFGKNMEINNLSNVTIINTALGDKVDKAVLKGNDSSMYSLSEQFKDSVVAQNTTIMPGDLIIQEKKLPLPNIVKIDVEGYEDKVIQGLAKALGQTSCRLVFCEIHPHLLAEKNGPEFIFNMLKNFGFNSIKTYPRSGVIHAFCYKK